MISLVRIVWKMTLCLPILSILLQLGNATTPSNSIESLLQDDVETTSEEPYDPFRFLLLCAPGSHRRNTCEKCTKVTRDPKTYKMCCENANGVRHWCRTFLDYTLPPRVVGLN